MTWLTTIEAAAPTIDDALALRPDLHDSFRAFYALFWEETLVDPVLLEVARLRIAAIHGCAGETALRYSEARDAGFDEGRALAAIGGDGDRLEDALERDCLALAEKFVLDVHSITDDDVACVRGAIGEPALVAFIEALALFDGFMRFRSVLGVHEQVDQAEPGASTVVDAPTFRSHAGAAR